MTFQTLDADLVDAIHDAVLNPGELTGHAMNKSLEGALGPVENRLAYDMVEDVFDLAAAYAVAIATGRVFNDGNKRTAFHAMETCLDINGVQINWQAVEIGDLVIRTAQGPVPEGELAAWLRAKA